MYLYDRVKQYTYVNGTGSASLSGSLGAFKSLSDVYTDGSRLYYTIENTGAFEVGLGTYSGGILYRDTVYSSSNSNNRVSFDGTRSSVFATLPATGIIYRDENGRVGIGTGNPAYSLDVNGSGRLTNSLYVSGNIGINEQPSSTNGLTIRAPSSQDAIQIKNFAGNTVALIGANGSNGGRIRFYNGGVFFNIEPSNAYINDSFTIGSTTANNSNQLTAIASTSAKVAISIQGAAAQSVNLTEWKDSSNNTLSFVASNGSGYFGSGISSSGDIRSSHIRLTWDGNGGVIRPAPYGPGNIAMVDTWNSPWLSLAGGGKVHIGGAFFNGHVQVETNGNVGIGLSSATYKLQVRGTGSFESGLVTRGLLDAACGTGAYSALNLAIGTNAGSTSNISNNKENTFIGINAGRYLNGNQSSNTVIGYNAIGGATISGDTVWGNVAIGVSVMADCRNGGNYNVAIGEGTLGQCDSMVSNNTIIGYNAGSQLWSAPTFNNNIFIGYQAGLYANHSTSNILIGNSISPNSSSAMSGVSNIFIAPFGSMLSSGYYQTSSGLHLGNVIAGSFATQRIKIGNVSDLSPAATLEVLPKFSTDVGFIVKGAAAQTANLTEWKNSSNSLLSYVDKDGSFSGININASGSVSFSNNSYTLDSAAGFARLRDSSNILWYFQSSSAQLLGQSMLLFNNGGNVEIAGNNKHLILNTNYGNNVGIGTGVPQYKFHVVANSLTGVAYIRNNSVSSSASGALVLDSADNGQRLISFKRDGYEVGSIRNDYGDMSIYSSTNERHYINGYSYYVHVDSSLISHVYNTNTRIQANKVGIGYIVPTYNLDVVGTGRFSSGLYAGNTSTLIGSNLVQPLNSTQVPMTIQGAASQSANLTEWKNSSNTTLAYVTNGGSIVGNDIYAGGGFIFTNGFGGGLKYPAGYTSLFDYDGINHLAVLRQQINVMGRLYVNAPNYASTSTSNTLHVRSYAAGNTGILIEGAANQSGNYLTIVNNSGTILSSISADGSITMRLYTDATRPASGNTGTIIFNTTDGNLNIWNGSNWILPDGSIT